MSVKDKVRIQRKVTLTLTVLDWQLYSTMDGSVQAALRLNEEVGRLLTGVERVEDIPVAGLGEVFIKEAKFGAADTEPRDVLNSILISIFGEQALRDAKWDWYWL